jgi:ankyrin repeat protein
VVKEFIMKLDMKLDEKIYGNLATVYHGTKNINSVRSIFTKRFKPGSGAFHGVGLYTVYDLNNSATGNGNYGDYVVKMAVSLQGIFNFNKVYDDGRNFNEENFNKEVERNGINKKDAMQLKKYCVPVLENFSITSEVTRKLRIQGINEIVNGYIYIGEQDGKCMVIYDMDNYLPLGYRLYHEKDWIKPESDFLLQQKKDFIMHRLQYTKDILIAKKRKQKLNYAFVKAIDELNITEIKRLLELGVDPDYNDNYAMRHIMEYINSGGNHVEILKLLVEYGADFSSDWEMLEYYVDTLISQNLIEGLKVFLQAIPDKDKKGFLDLCMHQASDLINKPHILEIFAFLLESGADIHYGEDRALLYACSTGSSRAFVDAVNANQANVVQLLLRAGMDVNFDDGYALTSSARNGFMETMYVLLEAGADVHINNDKALRLAIMAGEEKAVELLIRAGADVNGSDGSTRFLTTACLRNHTEIVKLLLDAGADVHANNEEALRVSVVNYNPNLVALLMKYGADIHFNNDEVFRKAKEINNNVLLANLQKFADMQEPIKESKMKDTAIICFQQANPPTIAHYQLFRKLISTAIAKKGDPLIFLSQDYNVMKNPIPWVLKVKYIKELFDNKLFVCDKESVKTFEDVLLFVYNRNYKKVVILAGKERISDIEAIIDDNDSKDEESRLFNFDDIEVIASGNADPDLESSEDFYSPAQARNAVLDNDFAKFRKIIYAKSNEQATRLFTMMKTGLGLTEHIRKRK